ncbi:hypothetical protein EJ02DRAFT_440772 [Clathrospora elynae]|uniref:Uncharacterized protein n=1 Tax=Clathrospora elynae TaxID=706981 RepID=A0A6A5TD87_9PLEO|nr:hypothetical protein EJ02DRAFT_440772 [Clathrospora elynae]
MVPPASASQTYTALYNTALAFIKAQTQDEKLPTRMDFDRVRTFCSPTFQHSWGHNYAVSLAPPLQGSLSFDGFVAHLQSMLPKLESWKAVITDIVVDEVRMRVVLRITFLMRAKGAGEEEVLENDLLWVFDMERDGDGGEERMKIRKSVEFIDGIAGGKLKELMMRKM